MLFAIVALTAGVAAAYLAKIEIARHTAAAKGDITQVAIAAANIPRGTTLRAELIDFVDWPAATLPKGATTKATVASLSGRILAHDVEKGEPLLEVHLASKDKGAGLAAVLPDNERAMTVMVNEVIGVAGFIHPEDFVDVIATMSASPSNNSQEMRAKIILQNVKVMAVGQEMVTEDSKPVKVSVVTLLVNAEQSEKLALASTQGKILLTLRSRVDAAEVNTPGVSPPELFGLVKAPPPPAASSMHHVRPAPKEQKQDTKEVVEVMRGDHLEERKVNSPVAK
jgi:pilus assembly protein CpaB